MALVRCRACGELVFNEAGVCPHCGSPIGVGLLSDSFFRILKIALGDRQRKKRETKRP